MKQIYILRHGETDLNLKGMVQGRGVNAPLNETGKRQAFKTFEALSGLNFDQVYTSSLLRTHQTVEHFPQDKIELAGFDEISWGSMEGVVPTEETRESYAKTIERWRQGDLDLNFAGGESPREVMARQKEAMNIVMSDDAKKVLICMHGRAVRVFLSWLLHYPLEFMDQFTHRNCCYYKLTYTDVFRIDEFCVVDHLVD